MDRVGLSPPLQDRADLDRTGRDGLGWAGLGQPEPDGARVAWEGSGGPKLAWLGPRFCPGPDWSGRYRGLGLNHLSRTARLA